MTDGFDAIIATDGPIPVIELVGQVDGAAETDLLRAVDRVLAAGGDRILLDFSRTDYINSTGLAVIVQVLARARTERRAVHAVGLSDHYREIFEITRLSDFVTVHADRAAMPA
jgi:anti-sigma B factor antagonist